MQVIINQGDFIQKGGKKEIYGDYKTTNTTALTNKNLVDKDWEKELKSYIVAIKIVSQIFQKKILMTSILL